MYNRRFMFGGLCTTALMLCYSPVIAQSSTGVTETADTAVVRPALNGSNISGFVSQRGPFNFPSPYGTQGYRLTNSDDCGGQDCVNDAGYAYWRNINNHIGQESMLIMIGLQRNRGGKGPNLFQLHKASGQVTNLGSLFPASHRLSWASGEGWYFSATKPTKLYVNDGSTMARFDVITEQMETVFDVRDKLGTGHYIAQMHSSDDDRVHSVTVKDNANYRALGCMAYVEDQKRFYYYPISASYDECQIDRSGEWLLIKANLDGINGEDNLIVNLVTGQQRTLNDRDGAAGHSDMGHGYMIAADNWAANANTWKVWDFNKPDLRGEQVYHNDDWSVFSPAHVSHTNARGDLPMDRQYACGSSVNRKNGVHANEVICFSLDGSTKSVAIAPTMTSLDASGGGDDYRKYAKGNLDVTGQYFFWTSNLGGSRLDAFIVKVPDNMFGDTGDVVATPPPSQVPAPTPPAIEEPAPQPSEPTVVPVQESSPLTLLAGDAQLADAILWESMRNVSVSGNRISKTSGCHGCADAGGVSLQHVAYGNADMEFTAISSTHLLIAGITTKSSAPSFADFAFGLRLQNGVAEVREGGSYRSDIRFKQGDRFTIRLVDGQVHYAVNGSVFYKGSASVSSPLYAGVTFYDLQATIENVTFTSQPAPGITIQDARLTAADQVEIRWLTDKPAESLVQYGTDVNYTKNSNHDASLKTSHAVVLKDLLPGLRYHFRALTRSADGHISASGDFMFDMPD